MSVKNTLSNNEIEKKAIISGYINNNKGRPLAGVKVKCDQLDTITLFNGLYKFSVEPGTHIVNVDLKDYFEQEAEIFLEEGEERNLDFRLEEEIGESRIYGFVFDDETGAFIGNGSVILIQTTINKSSKIDPKTGLYELNNLNSGTYDIWTSILHYEDKKHVISIEGNEEKRHDFYVGKKEDEEVPWG